MNSKRWKAFGSLAAAVMLLCCITAEAKYYPENEGNVYIHSTNKDKKQIALTFDDGPRSNSTEEILDILDKYGIKGTFFVLGENAERLPAVVKREFDEGHEVANHTFDHERLDNLGAEEIRREITEGGDAIINITGQKPTLFRPPYGFANDLIGKVAEEEGYKVILWTKDTEDWTGRSAQDIADYVLNNIENGDIILMHDTKAGSYGNTAKALEIIIPALKERGFEFVTVSQLLANE